jgi:hypothetical protein
MGNREALLRARTCLADKGHVRTTAKTSRVSSPRPTSTWSRAEEAPEVGSRLAAAIEEARGKPAHDGQAWLSPRRRRKPRWGSPGLS